MNFIPGGIKKSMNKKKIGKKQVAIVVSIFALAILTSVVGFAVAGNENDSAGNYLGTRASEIAKDELPFVKGDPNILAMTDAGYAIVGGEAGGKTTEECIDGITASSGCTMGKGNLLLIHRSKEKTLWFAFFNKSSGQCVYLEANNSVFGLSVAEVEALPDDTVFTKIAKANIGADKLLSDPGAWQLNMNAKVFGGNEFSIITIANVWAKGAPYEFLKAAEFHNHICPGLTSGYFIVKYLDENLPLQSPNDKYEIIACPPWCKDDAFQVIFDKTVGKRFVAMHLTPEDSAQLPGVAGIYIRWNRATDTGHGLVLAFNWTKAKEVCEVDPAYKNQPWYWWWMRLKMDMEMMDIDDPEMFVSTVKEFDLNSKAELMALKYAGNNPYVELGLLPDPALANLVGADNIAMGNLLGCRASEFAMENMSFEKYDPNILAMTDAGYAVVKGTRTENCIDGITASSGCSVGKGNLLVIRRSRDRPLWFAFFDKTTKDCLYLEVNNSVFDNTIEEFMTLPDEEVFAKVVKENISPERLLNESYAPVWNAKMRAGIFGGGSGPFTNEFTFMTIPNVWAKGNGSPRELLAASQFHNHICPGLTAGYFILEYLDEYLPLEKPSQRYQIIAIPPYCKDDILQWNLEASIGNKNYVAKDLTKEQKENLSEKAKNVAGIFIRWDSATGTGDGLVLAFNWTKACEISEFPYSYFRDFQTHRWWWARLKMDLDMMDYIDEPETVIETIMEFDVNNPSELSKLKSAGVNPLDELGLMGNKWTGTQSIMVIKPDGTTQNVSMTGLPKHHFLDPGKDLDDPNDDVNYDAVKVTDFLTRAGLSDADLQGKLFNFVGNDGFDSLILHRTVSDLPTYDDIKGAYLHYRPRGKVRKIYTITVWWTEPHWLLPGAEKVPYAMNSSYRIAFLDNGGKIEVIDPSTVKYWQGNQTLTVIDNKTGTITHTETVNLSNIETETVTINGTSQDAVRLVRVITNGGRTHLWGSRVDVRPATGPGLGDTVGYDNLPRWTHRDIFTDGYFYQDGDDLKLWFCDDAKAHWRMDQDLNGGTVEILSR